MTKVEKLQIDEMLYEQMLRRHRFAQLGDRQFQGERGAYFKLVMYQKRREIGDDTHACISKEIGWG